MEIKFTGATHFDALKDAAMQVARLESSLDFYRRRCEALQAVQDKMRDPERKAVCE